MKAILLILGVVFGFLVADWILHPRGESGRLTQAASTASTVEQEGAAAAPASEAVPEPATTTEDRLARARPAFEKPSVFWTLASGYSFSPESRIEKEFPGWREDSEIRAIMLAEVRRQNSPGIAALQYLVPLTETEAQQLSGIAEEEFIFLLSTSGSLGDRIRLASDHARQLLEETFDRERLERISEFLPTSMAKAQFAIDEFVNRGLPPLTPAQIDIVFGTSASGGADGRIFRERQLTFPLRIPDDATAAQRNFLETYSEQRLSGAIAISLTTAKVRDPEVFDIWPE